MATDDLGLLLRSEVAANVVHGTCLRLDPVYPNRQDVPDSREALHIKEIDVFDASKLNVPEMQRPQHSQYAVALALRQVGRRTQDNG